MRNTRPVMTEATTTLKPRGRHEPPGRKQPRLQRLSLVARGPARRQDVAQLLGVHRHTIGHWLASDEAGGLTAWLEVDVPAGTPVSLPPDGLVGLEQVRRQPAGGASYEAWRHWVKQTSRGEVHDHTLDTLVRPRFTATLKVPRPRHTPPRRPCLRFRRPARRGCRAACHRPIPAQGACSAQTKVAWAYGRGAAAA
jgi:hypothetical protein